MRLYTWVSAIISLFPLFCAVGVDAQDALRSCYTIITNHKPKYNINYTILKLRPEQSGKMPIHAIKTNPNENVQSNRCRKSIVLPGMGRLVRNEQVTNSEINQQAADTVLRTAPVSSVIWHIRQVTYIM